MNPTLDAFLHSWPAATWLWFFLALSTAVYLRGWLALRRPARSRWRGWQLAAFLAAQFGLLLALGSPIEPFSALLLQVHMVQHLLLMVLVPALFWLSEPFFPLLRGLPRSIRAAWLAPFIRSEEVNAAFRGLTHPAVALPINVLVTWGWHLPPIYDLALRRPAWHYLQHISFLGAALLFWYAVVRPYPGRARWPNWLLIPYLILADLQNTLLSALLAFSPRVLYGYYLEVPRISGITALADQAAAGAIMWVPGSLAFLLPLCWVAIGLLSGQRDKTNPSHATSARAIRAASKRLPILHQPAARQTHSVAAIDLLRLPLLGPALRWPQARLTLQLALGVLAAIVILDGLSGPQAGPLNVAGVLPWIHWRGLVVLALLTLGNLFCMACPFTLPRAVARKWIAGSRLWPRPLRNKWPAVLLLVIFLWAYEAFSLWDSPWLTAWIAIAYFVAATLIDGCFQGAAFCKYVCPIGQFNFVQSLVSPFEVRTRDSTVCASCQTKDCIRGSATALGCDMELFQPRKHGNMDCTFCLACVHACPHDNIGVLASLPARQLWRDRYRSGIGYFGSRPDLAALVLVLVLGAFANAAGMTAPVLLWQDRMAAALGIQSRLAVISLYYAAALVLLPAIILGLAAIITNRLESFDAQRPERAGRHQGTFHYVYALVPLGFGMWLAHYSFHFFTSWRSVIPTMQRFASDWGFPGAGTPRWACACCALAAAWIPRAEILFLDLGLLLSLYVAYRIATADGRAAIQALKSIAPWAMLILLCFAAGVWIVLQPMEMRGLLPADEVPQVAEVGR